jgi:hypothetical protein
VNGLASVGFSQHKGSRQVPILDGRIGKPVKFRHVPNAVRLTLVVFMPLDEKSGKAMTGG